MNLNNWAKEITLKEKKKKQVSIAQVKEIMKIILTDLAKMPENEREKIFRKY